MTFLLGWPLLAAAGFGMLAAMGQAPSYWVGVFPGLSVLALGAGIAVAPLTDAVLGAVDDEYEGAADTDGRLVYSPQRFSPDHGGKTKQQLLAESPFPARSAVRVI